MFDVDSKIYLLKRLGCFVLAGAAGILSIWNVLVSVDFLSVSSSVMLAVLAIQFGKLAKNM
jgi:hypothetical protein